MLAESPIGLDRVAWSCQIGQRRIRGTMTATAGERIFAERKSLPMRIAVPAPGRRETTLSVTARAHPALAIPRNAQA